MRARRTRIFHGRGASCIGDRTGPGGNRLCGRCRPHAHDGSAGAGRHCQGDFCSGAEPPDDGPQFGYLDLESHQFGTPEDNENPGVYYYIVDPANAESLSLLEKSDSALHSILPFASVDETVRLGGSYILRYQKSTGLMLNVFYARPSGNFAHTFNASEYEDLLQHYRDTESVSRKNQRRSYRHSAVIGWYGGVGDGAGIYLASGAILKLSGKVSFGGTGTDVGGNIVTTNGNWKNEELIGAPDAINPDGETESYNANLGRVFRLTVDATGAQISKTYDDTIPAASITSTELLTSALKTLVRQG